MAIRATFPSGVSSITAPSLHQWDYGQTLEIELADLTQEVAEVHFACLEMDEAIVSPCAILNGVAVAQIPDKCLEQTTDITAWIYEIDGSTGTTTKTVKIPVIARTRPALGDAVIPTAVTDRYTQLITEVDVMLGALSAGSIIPTVSYRANMVRTGSDQYKEIREALLQLVYPIGSIYMSTANQSPAAFLGGTWVAWGEGRVPVGVKALSTDTWCAAPELTGGESATTLTVDNMPAHNHKGETAQAPLYRHPAFVDDAEVSGVKYVKAPDSESSYNYEVQYKAPEMSTELGYGISYTPKVIAEYGVPTQGRGVPHNNLQPYITCYMWKRTA